MNFKSRSILKLSLVVIATIGLAIIVGFVVRSPGSNTNHNSLDHVHLVSSASLSGSTRIPVVGILPNASGWALTTAGLELTTNDGTSFSIVQSPIPLLDIGDVAVNNTHVSVAGVIDSSPVIKVSSDSGKTWQSVILPAGSGNAGGVQFITQSGAIIGLSVTDVTSSNFSVGEWYATADGGATWSHHSIPAGGVLTAVGGEIWLSAGPQFASLYHSGDNGATWSKVLIPTAALGEGDALSVPGQFENGNTVLIATTPNIGTASTFGVTVYISSDLGANWKVLAQTSFAGQINSGVTVTAAVSADTIWLGAATDQSLVLISSTGTITSTSSIAKIFPGGSIDSIIPTGSSSAWITTMKGECTSGKSSCSDVGVLVSTVNAGNTWSLLNLTAGATS